MISRPLLKQSCKANGVMWGIITFAVCFMLFCVMIIAGSEDLTKIKSAVQNTIIQGEIESSIEQRALNYYEISLSGLEYFDNEYKNEFNTIQSSQEFQNIYAAYGQEKAQQYLVSNAYANAVSKLQNYAKSIAAQKGYEENSDEAQEILGLIMYVFNPMTETTGVDGKYMFDDFYANVSESAPRYDFINIIPQTDEQRAAYRQEYAFKNSSIFLAGNMTEEENIDKVLNALKSYGVTKEIYSEFGFDDYTKVKVIARNMLINYRANLSYRLENIKDGETVESIKKELANSFTKSMLSQLPQKVTDALEEIGQMDLYGILVGSIFFKIAGLLLPIIYLIMASNNLIAGQVDSGSMAYVLSTPTKRKTVIATQMLFLVGSLFLMFVCTSISSVICMSIVNVDTSLTIGKLLLINLGAFIVMFAMSGICFLASSWFNRTKHSMAIGGGLNIFFLVATILGLFGSKIIPQVIRMDALKLFNYVSIISLFDVISILDGTFAFLWKLAILIVIGIICYAISFVKFDKKDLPL